ncbi:MAG: hypothetical protein KDE11_04040 [Rhodobacteraceae bacterium]|nr:hypothetical protein [Paracoccaceae bacterium]
MNAAIEIIDCRDRPVVDARQINVGDRSIGDDIMGVERIGDRSEEQGGDKR